MTEQNFESAKSNQNGADDGADSVITSQPKHVNVPDVTGILDQIDAVLEKNSEEFVSGFVQKGGQ